MEVRHALSVFAPFALAACAGIFGIDEITYVPPDASTDGDGGSNDDGQIILGDAGSLDPSDIPGVVLWLDARNGINGAASGTQPNGTPVTVWEDRSLAGNNVYAPNETADDPKFITSSINGLPAVDFSSSGIDGAAPSVGTMGAPSFKLGRGDFCVAVVAKFSNETMGHNQTPGSFISNGSVGPEAGAGFSLMGGNQVAVDMKGPESDGGGPILGIGLSSPAGSPYAYNDGAPHVLIGRRYGLTPTNTTTLELRVDGHSFGTYSSLAAFDVDNSDPVQVSDLFDNLDGQVAQVIVIGGTFDDASLAALENYLLTTYAIPQQK